MKQDIQIAEYITSQCEQKGIDLCGNFEDWTKVAFALADLGEEGRPLFHHLARLDERYSERENERKFSNALRTASRVKFATLVYMAKQNGISLADIKTSSHGWRNSIRIAPRRRFVPQVDYLPTDLVKGAQIGVNALVGDFLCHFFDLVDVLEACNAYMIRSTPNGETVFPQIDTLGRLRTGKIIMYGRDGHRIKERHADWLHSRWMRAQGRTAQDFHLQQCLFGEHLLPQRPTAQVGLVEAEKSALICGMAFPSAVWLATGGKMNLNADRCKCLAGRDVIVYPDADATAEWKERCKSLNYCCSLKVSDWAKDEPQGSKRDLADVVMQQKGKEVGCGD